MAISQQIQSSQLVSCDTASILKPFLPPHLGSFAGNQTIMKAAQYIGSFMVTGKGHHDRAEIVRQKLETARAYTHCKPIILLISLNGIKVCRDTDKHVYMAHALRRISYATCDPDNLQFAFLAREPKSEPNVQYCHAFVTTTPEEAEELNNIVGEAFRVAYAQQQLALLAQRVRNVPCEPPIHPSMAVTQPPADRSCPTSDSQPAGPPFSSSHVYAPNAVNHPVQSSPTRLVHHPCDDPSRTSAPGFPTKPLPPVPATSQSATREPTARLSSLSCEPSGQADVAAPVHRGHRGHKHHKHHKHRHKAKEADTQTSDITCSTDSGLQTGESAKGDARHMEQQNMQSPAAQRPTPDQLPPAPPPRGCSSLEADSGLVPAGSRDGPKQSPNQSSPARSGGSAKPTTSVPVNGVDTACLQSILEELSDGNMARPSSEASRPQSQHSYDIAEHQSCGALSPVPFPNIDATAAPTSLGGTHPEIPSSTPGRMATTTTSSSTTGCSTATSGSARSGSGSAGGSLSGRPNRSESHPTDVRTDGVASSAPHTSPSKTKNIMSHRNSGNPDPVTPCGDSRRRYSRIPDPSPYDTLYESEELAHVAWYQPRIPREAALELLSRQPPGSFIIRDSGTHANCYALSLRFGEGSGRCMNSGMQSPHQSQSGPGEPMSERTSGSSSYLLQNTGISHFLIQRTPNGGVRLKGLDKEWPSLSCLVLHLTVMPEMLPCPLRLPKSAANPAFSPSDGRSNAPSLCELSPGAGPCHGAAHSGNAPGNGAPPCPDDDDDYQRLSDFSAIMADLKMQPRVPKRPDVVRSGR